MFRLASTPARCAGAPESSNAASGVPFTAASIRDGSAIILRMSLGCGLRLSRWASIRRGPSVKNSFSYSFLRQERGGDGRRCFVAVDLIA